MPKPQSPLPALAPLAERTPLQTAQTWCDNLPSLPAERVTVSGAMGRIPTEVPVSPLDLPPVDRSAMDGYALRSDDGISPRRIIGQASPDQGYPHTVVSGEAVRISTGATLPTGCDAVVPQEQVQRRDDTLTMEQAPVSGDALEPRAADIARGQTLLAPGRTLRSQDIALLIRVGIAHIDVIRRPRVRLIATGDELVVPGCGPPPWESNLIMLAARVGADGGVVVSQQWLADDPEAIHAALTAPGADLVLVSGGSGPGPWDHPPQLLAQHGELVFRGLALRPAATVAAGMLGEVPVLLLPGNPAACLGAYDLLAGRVLRRCGGYSPNWPGRAAQHPLATAISSRPGVAEYWRVRVRDGQVEPITPAAPSRLSTTTNADGFVVVAADCSGLRAGESVVVHFW